MDNVILRNYRAGDASAVSRLFRKVYGEHYAQHQVYLPWMITANHTAQRWHSLLAVQGNKVIGHAALCRHNHANIAEFALAVVDPACRGQNIGTHLARQLLVHAQALGYHGVMIKQVTWHPYTQRLASTLGFHNTGILPDYAPSPLGIPDAETLIVGYKPIDGFSLALPAVTWPEAHEQLRIYMNDALGISDKPVRAAQMPPHFEHAKGRYDVEIARLESKLLTQLGQLPKNWLICLRLRLTQDFAADAARLATQGFHFTGLAPDEHVKGWSALFHRGHQPRQLQLHCPYMQRLHEHIQPV